MVEQAAKRPVAALVEDLFFSSRITQALHHLGHPAAVVPRAHLLEESVRAQYPALVLIDLGVRRTDWAATVQRLRAQFADLPIVAFGPHRDLDTRNTALAVGCTEVVANSKLVADLPRIVERYAGGR